MRERRIHCKGLRSGRGPQKDPSQRRACRCVGSKDIGMYDTFLYGCLYCYATGDFNKAKENYRRHDPSKPSLILLALKARPPPVAMVASDPVASRSLLLQERVACLSARCR